MSTRSIVKKLLPQGLFQQIEPIGHKLEAMVEESFYGFPGKSLKIIGVTGTDGKTTTSTLITQILRNSGYKVAMMTTVSVDYGDGKGPHDNPTRLTSLGSLQLIKELKKIKEAGAEWLVLETTSHALAQNRVWGVPYYLVVMTNVSHEHLDYHRTFERYRDAKRLLFKLCNKNSKGLRTGILNADDPSADLFAKDITNRIDYGVQHGSLRATNIKLSAEGSTYTARFGEDKLKVTCNLPGSFNVYNSLAAVGAGIALGLKSDHIVEGIASLQSVEGRMTRVDEGQNYGVIVDYAHTPESFDKILKEIKPLVKGRIICAFGSAGRRDESKRAEQGRIAGKWSDIVIATEEDDRDIDGQEILEQIAGGAESVGKVRGQSLFLIHEREAAVHAAIKLARPGDVVVLLGKGHEKSILSNGPKAAEYRHLQQNDDDPSRVVKRAYDEVTVARQAIKAKDK